MKNKNHLPNKEGGGCFPFLQISLIYGFIKDYWVVVTSCIM